MDPSVVDRHHDADRESLANIAQENSEEAVSQQHRAISDYVAAQTALGKTTGNPEQSPIDPFSFQSLAQSLPPLHPLPSNPPSNRAQVRQTIAILGVVDDKVQAHLRKVGALAAKLASSHPTGASFPFQSLQEEARDLKDQLKLVKLKAPPVVLMRDGILAQVEKSIASLKEKEAVWTECLSRKAEAATKLSQNHIIHNSGEYPYRRCQSCLT